MWTILLEQIFDEKSEIFKTHEGCADEATLHYFFTNFLYIFVLILCLSSSNFIIVLQIYNFGKVWTFTACEKK